MEPDIGVHSTSQKRLSRENSIEKKRKMRQVRKHRLKSRGSKFAVRKSLALEREPECQHLQALLSESERTVKVLILSMYTQIGVVMRRHCAKTIPISTRGGE